MFVNRNEWKKLIISFFWRIKSDYSPIFDLKLMCCRDDSNILSRFKYTGSVQKIVDFETTGQLEPHPNHDSKSVASLCSWSQFLCQKQRMDWMHQASRRFCANRNHPLNVLHMRGNCLTELLITAFAPIIFIIKWFIGYIWFVGRIKFSQLTPV